MTLPLQSPSPLRPDSLPPRAASADARQLLTWACRRFGDGLVLASALGPQSLIVLDLLHRIGRRVRTVFVDTDLHFPQTYALKKALEERYGVHIEAVAPALSLLEQETLHGPRLWETDPDRCCALRKVAPLRRALEGREAWISGLRRSGSATRAAAQPIEWDEQYGLVKVNPLAAWSRGDVERYLAHHDVPVNALRAEGYASIGCWPCTAPSDGADERSGRWKGRAKTECGIHGGPAATAGGAR